MDQSGKFYHVSCATELLNSLEGITDEEAPLVAAAHAPLALVATLDSMTEEFTVRGNDPALRIIGRVGVR